MFCLDEPDRHPSFSAANDRTLAFAERSEGRLVPFVRLDLTESPIEEAIRCLDRGARGIKLHPRAQKFQLNDERLAPVFELAADRERPDPDPRRPRPAADRRRAGRLVERYEHAADHRPRGIADLAALADRFSGRPGVFFDTSVWSPLDMLDLYRLVAPGQVLYASDYPYGQQPGSLLLALRTARIAGLDDTQMRNMLGRQRAADRDRRAAAAAHGAAAAPRRSRSRSRSRASTRTSRWRRRCSGCARPTRSASSASR